MKRFVHEKSNSWVKQTASVALFLAIFLIFTFAISTVSQKTDQQRMESLHQSISRGIAHCYATQGRYPESLQYLQEHYGIHYNTEEYFVDYQILGENIFPDVTIIRKQEER